MYIILKLYKNSILNIIVSAVRFEIIQKILQWRRIYFNKVGKFMYRKGGGIHIFS